jgi:CRISPR type I-E-associated protein CasB/Cse2
MSDAARHQEFIRFLHSLALRDDRAELAQLRRGLGRSTPDFQSLRLLSRFLPDGSSDFSERERRVYFLVAPLFALNPLPGGRGNIGDAIRRAGLHEGAQRRFQVLLNSHFDELPHRLRQTVNLCRSHDAPIHWLRLLTDLLHWDAEGGPIQLQWARTYWGESGANHVGETSGISTSHVS